MFWGQPTRLLQVLQPQAILPDLLASTRCLLTSAMPISRWYPTLIVLEPFLWLYFCPHELVLLPNHGYGYRSIVPYPMSLAGHLLLVLECLDAGLFLQDLVLSPLHAIFFMSLDRVGHLPWPGSPSLGGYTACGIPLIWPVNGNRNGNRIPLNGIPFNGILFPFFSI